MDLRLAGALLAALAIVAVLAPRGAAAQVSPERAERIADRDGDVVRVESERGSLERIVSRDDGSWRIAYFDDDEEVVRVIVAADGSVRESWTGHQIAWRMARGYEGQFGHALNAPYVWLPLCVIFLLGLLDWRRPLRVAHLDLLVLLGFGASHLFFNRGEIGVSVPLAYVPLAYLLARMVWIGFRGSAPLRPTIPALWLGVAAAFLIAFRVTLNIVDSGVIDVGYAGVIGADRVTSGEPIYGNFPEDNRFGDTYGPANYYAYVPFELALPWSGAWDQLPAARGAAIAFDLATVIGLFFLGSRVRTGRGGRELGVVLAFAWLAFPYTAFALQSSSNDALVGALIVWSLVAFASPIARGALLALAAATKFAPLVLVPLYAAGAHGVLGGARWRPDARGRGREAGAPAPALAAPVRHRRWQRRAPALFGGSFVAVAALVLVQPALDPGLATFWERTIANQADRESPFSIWGQAPGLGWARAALIAAVAALALGLALVPRHRSLATVGALAAAALIALQLTTEHWFYLYIPWFLPPLLLALLASRPPPAPSAEDSPTRAAGESERIAGV